MSTNFMFFFDENETQEIFSKSDQTKSQIKF